jgi:DNA-binding GntR family transcriptional regulator
MTVVGLEGLEQIASGESLADRAYQHLVRAILRNELRPGTPLSVPELARRMNVSRSPVREAVQRLIHDGLAEHVMHRGAVVTRIDPSSFHDLLEVRQLLEGLAARLAAERISPEEVEQLGATLQEHEVVVAGDDLFANVELDVRFHSIIRRAAGNHDLDAMLARTQARAHLSLHTLWRGPRDPQAMLDEHRAVYAAIAAGDPAAADAAAQAHIQGLRDRVAAGVVGFDHLAGAGK